MRDRGHDHIHRRIVHIQETGTRFCGEVVNERKECRRGA